MHRWELDRGLRFLTFSTQHRLPLLSKDAIAEAFTVCLAEGRLEWNFQLYAWVVMPEHVHLLVMPPPGGRMSPVLQSLKIASSKRIVGRWRRLGPAAAKVLAAIDDGKGRPRFWQKGGGFDHNVRNRDRFCKFVRYIHENPVERGLVTRPEDYKWSSVRWWMGVRENEVECDPPPGDPRGWERWKGYTEQRRSRS